MDIEKLREEIKYDEGSVNEIPIFSASAPGGRAKEQTLGIRR